MTTYTGKIIATNDKQVTPPGRRPFTVHSVTLEDGTTVEVGYKQPYRVGEYFSRDCEMKFGSLKDVGPAAPGASVGGSSPPPKPYPVSAGAAPAGRTFPVNPESPEMSIIRQNALTNARELITAVSMGYTVDMITDTAVRREMLDKLTDDIMYVAYKFADFSSGQREVKHVAEMARLNPPSA